MSSSARVLEAAAPPSTYLIAGIPCAVSASSALLDLVEATYGAYRLPGTHSSAYELEVTESAGDLVVTDSRGHRQRCRSETDAALLAVEAIARHVTSELGNRGIFAIHAAALSRDGHAVLLCGRSRSGKTTLALALLANGFGLLSDEFALSADDAGLILPYHRGVHVRPGTPELVPELAFLSLEPQHHLSGGFQWTVRTSLLDRVFPGCLAAPATVRTIVLLGTRGDQSESRIEPVSPGIASVELLRQTTATPDHFDAVLSRMAKLTQTAECVRLVPGRLESSVSLLGKLVGRHVDG